MPNSILVTGASGNIGKAVAKHFIAARADNVLLTCRHTDHLTETISQLARWGCGMVAEQVVGRTANLNGINAIAELSEWLRLNYYQPTTLVCAHGMAAKHDSTHMDAMDFQDVLWLNTTACLQLAQLCFPFMADAHFGRIVFISSIHGQQTYPERAAYAASKGGLEALCRVLALEWARNGITVNCVAPGQLTTPMHGSPMPAAALEQVRSHTPTGALVTPEQIAACVGWLCSTEAANVTGQTIRIDGGVGVNAAGWEEEKS